MFIKLAISNQYYYALFLFEFIDCYLATALVVESARLSQHTWFVISKNRAITEQLFPVKGCITVTVTHISNTADIPSRDILIKGCITEHVTHISNIADIPFRDIPIKGCSTEHVSHVSNTANIPSRDIPIKW